MLAHYTPSIGLEVHAELSTRTKIFCGCSTASGAPANTQVCPICLGFPGVLPMLNREVVEYGLRMSLALHCGISVPSIFERKGYYYPDLPKNFQVSQKRAPLGVRGYLDLVADGVPFRVGISDVHMEEDAAKLLHPEGDPNHSLVDFNRSGVPLLEIVSDPDMHSVAQVEAYMTAIRSTLRYLGLSHARMEMGEVRFEASISVAPDGATELGTRVEIKNLNSFRAVTGGVAYEIARQTKALEAGEKLHQETRLWDPERNATEPMRSKETAMDYRYFPEPDLTPLETDEAWIARVKADLPKMAQEEKQALLEDGASEQEASTISAEKEMVEAHKELKEKGLSPKASFRWLTGPVLQRKNELAEERPIISRYLNTSVIVDLEKYVGEGRISGTAARAHYPHILDTGQSVEEVIREKGEQISDETALIAAVEEAIAENQDAVENYRKGNEKSIKFLVGQVMKKSQGRANPQVVNRLLEERLR